MNESVSTTTLLVSDKYFPVCKKSRSRAIQKTSAAGWTKKIGSSSSRPTTVVEAVVNGIVTLTTESPRRPAENVLWIYFISKNERKCLLFQGAKDMDVGAPPPKHSKQYRPRVMKFAFNTDCTSLKTEMHRTQNIWNFTHYREQKCMLSFIPYFTPITWNPE